MREMTPEDMHIAEMLLGGRTQEQIAESLGVSRRTVIRKCNAPHFLEYMQKKKGISVMHVVKPIAEQEIAAETKKLGLPTLNRVNVLGRLWEIAHIDPSVTKGNIQTQKEAASELAKMAEFSASALGPDEAKPAGPDVYQPAWTREPLTQ
jgi:hypothetical protein